MTLALVLPETPKTPAAVKYPPHTQFREKLIARVNAHFDGAALERSGGARMIAKTCSIFAWWLTSYLLLVFWASTWWQVIPLAISLALSIAGMGFNIQHDGSHGAYSKRKIGNRLSALTLDLMGGSSYMWHFKHNIFHHQYTNVQGVDDDLEAGPLLRLAEEQPRRWFHRIQHWYIWLLYAFLPPKWHFYDDFHALVTGRIGHQKFPRPKGMDLAVLFAGKAVFFTWGLVLPLCLHPVGDVLAVYGLCALVTGMTLGTVFQLAHCVEEADFARQPEGSRRMERSWVEHQLATTVDFAPRNRFLTWYLGGLNFQVEHHLFPRISHLHYPELISVVRAACAEANVPHLSHETMGSALASHVRYLKRLGRGGPSPVSAGC